MFIGFGYSPSRAERNVGVAIDSDAQAFFTAASITDNTQKSAVNQLVLDLKSYGIWTKCKAIYPICGGSASSHAVNLKTPGTYNLTYSTGWTHSSTGMLANGSSTVANTGLVPSSVLTVRNTHLSLYVRNDTAAGNKIDMGSGNATTANPSIDLISKYASTNAVSDQYSSSSNRISASNSDAKGFYTGSRTSISSHKLFKNGSVIATDASNEVNNSLPNIAITIGAFLFGASVVQYSDKQYAFVSIGDGLTDTEAANFRTAVQAYQTTLSRNV